MRSSDESTDRRKAGTMSPSSDDAPGAPPPRAQTREEERPRPALHKALTAASTICLSVGAGLTLVPIVAHLVPPLGVRSAAVLGSDLSGRERDLFLIGLGILLSCTIILVMQLWIRRDPLTRSSVGSALLSINLLDLFALASPVLTLAELYPARSLGAHLLIIGSILMTAGIVLLPPRPLAWPPQSSDDGRSPLHRLAGTLRSPRPWTRAAASTGLVVLTIVSTLLYSALALPTRALTASPSPTSGGGPSLITHTGQSGTWAVEVRGSQQLDNHLATAAGPVILSSPEKESHEDDEGRTSSTYRPDRPSTSIITLLNPATGDPQWSLELTGSAGRSTGPMSDSAFPNRHNLASGDAVTDPDGRLLAIHLAPTWNSSASEWITPIAVIDLTNGKTLRSVVVEGKILSSVLTSDTLAVQTANHSALEPGGTLLAYSLNEEKTSGPQRTTDVDTWLLGATRDHLLLSDQAEPSIGSAHAATMTQTDPLTGDEASSTDAVYKILPGGWVERFSSPVQTPTDTTDDNSWYQLDRELVDLSTGHTIDITGKDTTPLETSTGIQLRILEGRTGTPASTTVGVVDTSIPASITPAIEPLDSVLLITSTPNSYKEYENIQVAEGAQQPSSTVFAIRAGTSS